LIKKTDVQTEQNITQYQYLITYFVWEKKYSFIDNVFSS